MTDFEKFKKQFEDCYNDIYSTEPKENFLEIEDGIITLYGSMDDEITLFFDKDGNFSGWEQRERVLVTRQGAGRRRILT